MAGRERCLVLDREKEAWRNDAACFGMSLDIFFPESFMDKGPAIAVCETCPVRCECLEYAINMAPSYRYGVWGGFHSTQIMKKGRKWLDEQPYERLYGGSGSQVRVATNRGGVPQRHDNPQRDQQARPRRLGSQTSSDLRRERAAEAFEDGANFSCKRDSHDTQKNH